MLVRTKNFAREGKARVSTCKPSTSQGGELEEDGEVLSQLIKPIAIRFSISLSKSNLTRCPLIVLPNLIGGERDVAFRKPREVRLRCEQGQIPGAPRNKAHDRGNTKGRAALCEDNSNNNTAGISISSNNNSNSDNGGTSNSNSDDDDSSQPTSRQGSSWRRTRTGLP